MRTAKAIVTLSLLALAAACEPATTSVTAPDLRVAQMSASSPRSGALHVTKECSAYTGLAGSFCTITSSSLRQIPVGSKVIYAEAASATSLDTDVILDPPGSGNSVAFGHCTLDFSTAEGVCTFSGGTGKFKHFQASVAVSYLSGPNWAWNGTYSFGGTGGTDDDDHED